MPDIVSVIYIAKSHLTLWQPHGLHVALQALLFIEFSRQECWSGLAFPFPGNLPDPGIELGSPALRAEVWPKRLLWSQESSEQSPALTACPFPLKFPPSFPPSLLQKSLPDSMKCGNYSLLCMCYLLFIPNYQAMHTIN